MKKIFLICLMFSTFILLGEDIRFYNLNLDCSSAKKESVEYKICSNNILSMQDNILANMYKLLLTTTNINKNKLKEEQEEWLTQRNQCLDNKCIKQMYKKRIKQLNYISDLIIDNDFSAFQKIELIKTDKNNLNTVNEMNKYNFTCMYGKNTGLPTISRDKDLYYIDELSNKITESTNKNWIMLVEENFIDSKSNEEILKGRIISDSGTKYQPSLIKFFTYSKNWYCELKK